MLETVAAEVPLERLAVHFHDTYGQALANILRLPGGGVAVVDSAVGGPGRLPLRQGRVGQRRDRGRDLHAERLGVETGVELAAVVETGAWISGVLGRENGSKVGRARTVHGYLVTFNKHCQAQCLLIPATW